MQPATSDDLSALAIIRDMDSFDFGAFKLPVRRRLTPWKLWHYPFSVVVIYFLTLFAYHGPGNMAEAFGYGEYLRLFNIGVATVVSAGLDLLLITLVLLSPFMAMTVRIRHGVVEAWYYGMNLKRRHFKEPLANYTGVVLEKELRHVPAGETLAHTIVHCVELEHPDPLRCLPLYQGNEKTARVRLENAGRALGLPMLDASQDGRQRLDREGLLNAMESTIASGARDGVPFAKTGAHGVYARHGDLPVELQLLGRKRLRSLVDDLLKAGRVRKCAARGARRRQWLDVPGGPYDRGEGEV